MTHPTDILFPVFRREAQVTVQTMANVVAVNVENLLPFVKELLFERPCQGALDLSPENGTNKFLVF